MEEYTLADWIPFLVLMVASAVYLSRSALGLSSRRKRHNYRPLEEEYKRELEEHFLYYQNLSSTNKRKFETRVQAFIDGNDFIPRSYTHVNAEMKALIAGSAVQLTFGFEHLNLEHFRKILIYKDDYYSTITRKYHQGEVNTRGLIVLSWKNFVEGYEKHDDGRNLGLHEMAHALRLENSIYNDEYEFIDNAHIAKFERMAEAEMKEIAAGNDVFFRKYAAANRHEFFAVAVENFFERSEGFKEYHPELYHTMSLLLKQDPIRLFKGYNSVPF
ncbi:hypothetical protein Oweho_0801 [Owenweeksia hongkongensis DSM 17368]|uniref:DgsA anti-repressor MtfA n=1 Tax=Owenweeksia hongkongensis (strain DSM 17368 / CIP 108786 / JCM 12287 / NRRL B-23963 / UST20020801) TaxID=926562 RepID=G8R264_OWEHD|nr:zinc-dependent peptidase [Owenweeksia hongkongensis]AEV31814.1 hypothetical protein Oweho_0801 [Owenweeksia hongkongensis DSM 17368]